MAARLETGVKRTGKRTREVVFLLSSLTLAQWAAAALIRFVLDLCRSGDWIEADMKIKILFSLVLTSMAVFFGGCVGTPDGGTTIGMPLVKDTIVSRYERPVPQLVDATRVVLQRNGKMLVDNSVNNTFKAKVNQHTVWVRVSDVDGKLTQVTVQARSAVGGDVELAAELSKQIALQLVAEGNH